MSFMSGSILGGTSVGVLYTAVSKPLDGWSDWLAFSSSSSFDGRRDLGRQSKRRSGSIGLLKEQINHRRQYFFTDIRNEHECSSGMSLQ